MKPLIFDRDEGPRDKRKMPETGSLPNHWFFTVKVALGTKLGDLCLRARGARSISATKQCTRPRRESFENNCFSQ